MAAGVPPPPLNSPSGSYYWLEWYTNLTNYLNGTNIPWANLNFTNSNIHDIVNRAHNSLTHVQGGNAGGDLSGTGNAWHMTGRGVVAGGGVGTGFPTGWTTSHTGTGTYTITHNLGLSSPNLGAIATSITPGALVQYIDCTGSTSLVTVHTTNASGAAADADFTIAIFT